MIIESPAEAQISPSMIAASPVDELGAVLSELGMLVNGHQSDVDSNVVEKVLSPRTKRLSIAHVSKLLGEADAQLDSRDLLYLLLTYFVSAKEAEEGSERLLTRFGSIGGIISAPWQRVEAATGSDSVLPGIFKIIHAILINILREPITDRPIISNTTQLHEYLKVTLGHCSVETLRILYLDARNGLIRDEIQSRGTIDHVSLYTREILCRVFELGAKAIIIVHNHPSGNSEPTSADIELTHDIKASLERVGVALHDHIIVTRKDCLSFRHRRLL